jgi:hypothetical protein
VTEHGALIQRMRERVRQLRRMADMAHDPRMIEVLTKMAQDIEADAARLESE